jgi:hypothetical protein
VFGSPTGLGGRWRAARLHAQLGEHPHNLLVHASCTTTQCDSEPRGTSSVPTPSNSPEENTGEFCTIKSPLAMLSTSNRRYFGVSSASNAARIARAACRSSVECFSASVALTFGDRRSLRRRQIRILLAQSVSGKTNNYQAVVPSTWNSSPPDHGGTARTVRAVRDGYVLE